MDNFTHAVREARTRPAQLRRDARGPHGDCDAFTVRPFGSTWATLSDVFGTKDARNVVRDLGVPVHIALVFDVGLDLMSRANPLIVMDKFGVLHNRE
jgi:hypothetical protein